MRHNKILTRPAQPRHINFDDLYEEISQDWQDKAARLQARRWQHIHQKQAEPFKKRLMHYRISPRK